MPWPILPWDYKPQDDRLAAKEMIERAGGDAEQVIIELYGKLYEARRINRLLEERLQLAQALIRHTPKETATE